MNTTETQNPTITISQRDLANLLSAKGIIPPNSTVTDLWTSDYDSEITIEYNGKDVEP